MLLKLLLFLIFSTTSWAQNQQPNTVINNIYTGNGSWERNNVGIDTFNPVGIGSTNPGEALDIQGTVRATQFIVGSGGITLGGVNNTSWPSGTSQWTGTNPIYFNGNVGINSSNPGTALDVNGTTRTVGLTVNTINGLTQCIQANSSGVFSGTGSACGAGSGSGNVGIGTAGWDAYYATNGSTLTASPTIFISTSNNVGVNSTNPGATLDVAGTVQATGLTIPPNAVSGDFLSAIPTSLTSGNSSAGGTNWTDLIPLTGSTRLGFVATRGSYSQNFNSGLNQMMVRDFHVATDNISCVEFVFGNYWNNNDPETPTGATATITASLEYPVNMLTQVTFGGSSSGTIPNGGTIFSDPVCPATHIPLGTIFWHRAYFTSTAGVLYSTNGYAVSGYDYAAYNTTGVPDSTMTSGTAWATGNGVVTYMPLAIIGLTAKPSILMLGDSRLEGKNDTADVSGNTGYERLLARYYGYSDMGADGDELCAFIGNGCYIGPGESTQRMKLAPYATHVIGEWGINDMDGGTVSKAVMEQNVATFASTFSVPVYWTTLAPFTTSTDGWETLANQTPNAYTSVYNGFNDDLRTGSVNGLSGYLEIADSIESSRDSGLWAVNGTYQYPTSDGIHESHNSLLNEQASLNAILNSGKSFIPSIGGTITGTLNVQGGVNTIGNVGVGSLFPGQALDVQGTTRTTNLTVTSLTTGCMTNTNGVVSSTGSTCGSGGGGSNYWLNDTGNVGINTTYNVGIGTIAAGSALSIGAVATQTTFTSGGNGTIGNNLTVDGNLTGDSNIYGGNSSFQVLSNGNVIVNFEGSNSQTNQFQVFNNNSTNAFNVNSANSQISTATNILDGGNVNYPTGNMGIGTSSLINEINILGNIGIGSTSNSLYLTTAAPNGGAIIQGDVGIGTWLPSQILDVQGTINNKLLNYVETSTGEQYGGQ